MPIRLLNRHIPCARFLAAAVCLGGLLLSSAPVQAGKSFAPSNLVYLYPGSTTKLCVGQQTILNGWYKTGPNPLERLVDGPTPAPAPEINIVSTASIGKIAPSDQPVYYDAAGNFILTYTATKEGTAVIQSAIAGSSAAPIKLKVYKACKYKYNFYAEIHNSFTLEAVNIAETYRFTSSGALAPIGPADLADLRDDPAQLSYNGQLDSFSLPSKGGVTIDNDSYTPAQGSAAASAHGVFASDGSSLTFYMTKSRLKAQSELMIKIISKSVTTEAPFSDDLENAIFSFFNQHASQPDYQFVDLTVPADGGSFSIKVPDLNQVCDFLNQSPGFKCSVTARLDLEIVGK